MSNLSDIYRLAELGKTSAGFLHDMVNHLSAVTLSMNYFEERAVRHSELLKQHAEQVAHARKSIEEFAGGVRTYMKQGGAPGFFNPLSETRHLAELFRYRSPDTSVQIEVSGDTTLRLYGDRLRFGQIVSNILSNAIDATHQTDKKTDEEKLRLVTISCVRDGPYIKISVADTGPGIAAELQPRLFTPFVSTKQDRGTGLGLVSAQKIIVEDFRGKIELSSTPDSGTTVSLFFRAHISAHGKRF